MKTVKVVALVQIEVSDDHEALFDQKLADEAVSAFYEPDMDDSITEAIGRYVSDEAKAVVLEARITRRKTLRGL